MPSLFDETFATAEGLFTEAFGVDVRILRAGRKSDLVKADVVVTENIIVDESTGIPTNVQSRNYLIAMSAYAIDGNAIEPRAGDQIEEQIGGAENRFELRPVGKMPAFEWGDVQGRKWIVRTKRVA